MESNRAAGCGQQQKAGRIEQTAADRHFARTKPVGQYADQRQAEKQILPGQRQTECLAADGQVEGYRSLSGSMLADGRFHDTPFSGQLL